eukprot:gene11556-13489_t
MGLLLDKVTRHKGSWYMSVKAAEDVCNRVFDIDVFMRLYDAQPYRFTGPSMVDAAAASGNVEALRVLLDKSKLKVREDAMWLAIIGCHLDVVVVLAPLLKKPVEHRVVALTPDHAQVLLWLFSHHPRLVSELRMAQIVAVGSLDLVRLASKSISFDKEELKQYMVTIVMPPSQGMLEVIEYLIVTHTHGEQGVLAQAIDEAICHNGPISNDIVHTMALAELTYKYFDLQWKGCASLVNLLSLPANSMFLKRVAGFDTLARYGTLDQVKMTIDSNGDMYFTGEALKTTNVQVLKLLHQRKQRLRYCPTSVVSAIFKDAAMAGHSDIVAFMMANDDIQLDKIYVNVIAHRVSSLDCAKLLWPKCQAMLTPFNPIYIESLEQLEFLIKIDPGLTRTPYVTRSDRDLPIAMVYHQHNTSEYNRIEEIRNSCRLGNIEIIRHLCETYDMSESLAQTLDFAFQSGHDDVVHYLMGRYQCSFTDRKSFAMAGILGDIALYDMLCSRNPLNIQYTTLRKAISRGHLPLITYIIDSIAPNYGDTSGLLSIAENLATVYGDTSASLPSVAHIVDRRTPTYGDTSGALLSVASSTVFLCPSSTGQ